MGADAAARGSEYAWLRGSELAIFSIEECGVHFVFRFGAADAGASGIHVAQDGWYLCVVVFSDEGRCKAGPGCIAAVVDGCYPCLFDGPSCGSTVERHEVAFYCEAVCIVCSGMRISQFRVLRRCWNSGGN